MFLVIEGPDGTGKTTLAQSVVHDLKVKYDISALYTSEPTNSNTGLKIRDLA